MGNEEQVIPVPALGPKGPLQGGEDEERAIADPSLVGSDLSAEKMAMTIVRGYGTEVCRKYHEYTTGAAMGVVRKFG